MRNVTPSAGVTGASKKLDDENVEFFEATPSANADTSFVRTETEQDVSYLGNV